MRDLPNVLRSGDIREGHVQGIAVDMERGEVYYSFTTSLVKTDFAGRLLGSVCRLAGHLGCITFDPDRRRVYGSLELKHDAIGRSIAERTGMALAEEDAFYLVEFACEKIDRADMDAERDGVMRAVWLADVVEDYYAVDEVSGQPHRYGCSGIDGTAYGPDFGAPADAEKKITVCYGIYGDTARADNDHQVLLSYSPDVFDRFGQPLNQGKPHHSGPTHADRKYFFYTGNTVYGVQNLEYDAFSHAYFAAVYPGKKKNFKNESLFFIDAEAAPEIRPLSGRLGEEGLLLSPSTRLSPLHFPYGSTGIFACGDGTYYFSHPYHRTADRVFSSMLHRYRIGTYDERFELV